MNNEFKTFEELEQVIKDSNKAIRDLTKGHRELLANDAQSDDFEVREAELRSRLETEQQQNNYYKSLRTDFNEVLKGIRELRDLASQLDNATDSSERNKIQDRIDRISSDVRLHRLNLTDELQDDLQRVLGEQYPVVNDNTVTSDDIISSSSDSSDDTNSDNASDDNSADSTTSDSADADTSVDTDASNASDVDSNDAVVVDASVNDEPSSALDVVREELAKQRKNRDDYYNQIKSIEEKVQEAYANGDYPEELIDQLIDLYGKQSRTYAALERVQKQERNLVNAMMGQNIDDKDAATVVPANVDPVVNDNPVATPNVGATSDTIVPASTSVGSAVTPKADTAATPAPGDSKLDPTVVSTKPGRGLYEILRDIRTIEYEDGSKELINVTNGAIRRYNASNIKLGKAFTDKLKANSKTGFNFHYFISGIVPGAVNFVVSFVRKGIGKLVSKNTRKQIEALRKNLRDLPKEDMEVLYREFKGATAQNMVTVAPIVDEINNAIDEYVEREYIHDKRVRLNDLYNELINSYEEVIDLDSKRMSGSLSGEPLKAGITKAVDGSVDKIVEIRELQNEIQDLQSDGIRGRAEDGRSVRTKRNRRGGFTAVGHSTNKDEKLIDEEAKLESNINKSIRNGNDEHALRNFMKLAILEAENTTVETRILRGGKVSTGLRDFDPLVQKLDYSQDMLIRNYLTTIAVGSTAWAGIHQLINRHDYAKVQESLEQIKEYGDKLSGNRQKVLDGMEADRSSVQFDLQNANERADLDANGFDITRDSYITSDLAHHSQAEKLFETTNDQINSLNDQLSNGSITDMEYLDAVHAVNRDLFGNYGSAIKDSITILEKYKEAHPSIELDALVENCRRISDNADNLSNVTDVAVESVKIGDEISKLAYDGLKEFATTTSADVAARVVPLVSTALLAGYISSKANEYFEAQDEVLIDRIRELPKSGSAKVSDDDKDDVVVTTTPKEDDEPIVIPPLTSAADDILKDLDIDKVDPDKDTIVTASPVDTSSDADDILKDLDIDKVDPDKDTIVTASPVADTDDSYDNGVIDITAIPDDEDLGVDIDQDDVAVAISNSGSEDGNITPDQVKALTDMGIDYGYSSGKSKGGRR